MGAAGAPGSTVNASPAGAAAAMLRAAPPAAHRKGNVGEKLGGDGRRPQGLPWLSGAGGFPHSGAQTESKERLVWADQHPPPPPGIHQHPMPYGFQSSMATG